MNEIIMIKKQLQDSLYRIDSFLNDFQMVNTDLGKGQYEGYKVVLKMIDEVLNNPVNSKPLSIDELKNVTNIMVWIEYFEDKQCGDYVKYVGVIENKERYEDWLTFDGFEDFPCSEYGKKYICYPLKKKPYTNIYTKC